MLQGRTLQELASEVTRQRSNRVDFLAPTGQTRLDIRRVVVDDRTGEHRNVPTFTVGEKGSFEIQPTFHSQLAGRLKIPTPYYNRMLEEAPELLQSNVNHWLSGQGSTETRLIRTLEGKARAYLSNKFRALDNDELLGAMLPGLSAAGVEVKSCQVTERRMYLQAVSPRFETEIKVGDTVRLGVVISNSEIGFGALKIETLIYRLVCLNGMISGTALRKAHLGRRTELVEGASEFYRDETLEADDKAFFLKVRDTVNGVLCEENFTRQTDKLKDAAGRKLTGNPVQAIEVLQNKLQLTDGEKGDVLRHLIEGGDLSAWGVANAVTRTANDCEGYDRSVELERAGAEVIELPQSEWAEIAKAA